MSQLKTRARLAAKYMAPHGLTMVRQERARKSREAAELAERTGQARQRHEQLAKMATGTVPYSHDDSVAFLTVARDLDPHHVQHGSIPLASLVEARRVLQKELPDGRALVGLHVGNFVGISLAFLTNDLVERHPASVMVSVDPGTTHRGIVRPQEHALALLDRYGLSNSHVFAQGFSVTRAVGHEAHMPAQDFADLTQHHASEGVLDSLITAGNAFDVALMDGNHEGEYLQAEIERLHKLLRSGGVLIMDDVEPDGPWVGVFEVFERTKSDHAFELINADGRVALFRRV